MERSNVYYADLARSAATAAAVFVNGARGAARASIQQKADRSFVTSADLESEQLILEYLKRETPHFSFYTEEEVTGDRAKGEHTWIIDPIDGTHNYYYGLPCFAVQIALEHKGQIIAAAVALPAEGVVVHAARGAGCFVGDQRIRVSDRPLKKGLLMLESRWSETDMKLLQASKNQAHDIRIINSSTTSITYVALGRADALIDWDDKPWDLAAGSLLVEEAGGRVSNLSGGQFDVYKPRCIASNGVAHDSVLNLVRTSGAFAQLDHAA